MASDSGSTKAAVGVSASGDLDAVFRAHAPWLLRTLRRRFGPDVAEDLLQETYVRLARRISSKPVTSPKAYLVRIASNVFLDGYRRDRQRAEAEAGHFALPGAAEAASQIQTIVVREIVLGMPVKLRDVFLLSRAGGLSNQQIAQQLGISVKTVEWRMTRALAYCAAQLRS